MSLTAVRPYFRTHLNALGFKEWEDPFNIENIPLTILEKGYQIESRTVSTQSLSQEDITIIHQVVINIFRKGFRTPSAAMDQVLSDSQSIIERVLDPSNRLTGSVKNVKLTRIQVDPLADSNDNSAVAKLEFECLIIIDIGG